MSLRERFSEAFLWKDEGKGWGVPTYSNEIDYARMGQFKLKCHVSFRDSLAFIGTRSIQILIVLGKVAVKTTMPLSWNFPMPSQVPQIQLKCLITNRTVDFCLYRLRLSSWQAVLEFRPHLGYLSPTTWNESPDWGDLSMWEVIISLTEEIDREWSYEPAPFLTSEFLKWVLTPCELDSENPYADQLRDLNMYCISTLCSVYCREMKRAPHAEVHKLLQIRGRVFWTAIDEGIRLMSGWMYDIGPEVPRDMIDECMLINMRRQILLTERPDFVWRQARRLGKGVEYVDIPDYPDHVIDVLRPKRLSNGEQADILHASNQISGRPELGEQSIYGRAYHQVPLPRNRDKGKIVSVVPSGPPPDGISWQAISDVVRGLEKPGSGSVISIPGAPGSAALGAGKSARHARWRARRAQRDKDAAAESATPAGASNVDTVPP